MSKDRLSLDETINLLDKRKRHLTLEQVKEHLDNIEHCAKINTSSHYNSLVYSKQIIIDAFNTLKGERL